MFLEDIITDHRERMLNIKKYYPFFKLSQISFDSFRDGKFAILDMGYLTMAVIRFFIEENNFKDKDVTYPEYITFMTKCLARDFGLKLSIEENKEVADFVFDKLKNDGRPFVFEYFDPVDRKKKSLRLRLIESRIVDSTVWYQITSDAIEFYLDTKEIKDESKINVEQLLLEKLIESQNFKGGIEVVRRINSEVERLKLKKNEVMKALTIDIYSGLESYEQFVESGMKWFEDEQRLFVKNTQLIENAMQKASNDYKDLDAASFDKAVRDIYELETELKIAMSKHSELLHTCTELGKAADEILKRTKLSRLRTRFDYSQTLDSIIKSDDATVLSSFAAPLLGLNLRKSFNLLNIDSMLSFPPSKEEKGEAIVHEEVQNVVFKDELEDERIRENYKLFMHILLKLLKANKSFDVNAYIEVVKKVCTDEVVRNGDLYSFLVNLCQKQEYVVDDMISGKNQDTFLDEIITGEAFREYGGIVFEVVLASGKEESIELMEGYEITKIEFLIKV